MEPWNVGDVMTGGVVAVAADCGYKQVADLLVAKRISAVPVVDSAGAVLGVVSEVDLLAKLNYPDRLPTHPLLSRRRASTRRAGGDTAGELMSSPAITVRVGVPITRAARLMEAARVKRLPVVDDAGRLVGILSRSDLVRLYTRPDNEIRDDVTDELRALGIDPTVLRVRVEMGVVTLSGSPTQERDARFLVRMLRAVPGVVDVVDQTVTADQAGRSTARTGGW
jgi:CBS domain-containing protein